MLIGNLLCELAIYCVNFGVNVILQKFCMFKKNDKYEVCLHHHKPNYRHLAPRPSTSPSSQSQATAYQTLWNKSDVRLLGLNQVASSERKLLDKADVQGEREILFFAFSKIFSSMKPSLIRIYIWGCFPLIVDIVWTNYEWTLQKTVHFCVFFAQKYAGLKKASYCQCWGSDWYLLWSL